MSFGQAIKTVFKNLTNFQGRSRRSEFWWFYLFISLVSLPLSLLMTLPLIMFFVTNADSFSDDGTLTDQQASQFLGVMALTYGLAFVLGIIVFLFVLAVWVRRLHDAGFSGHWLWLSLIGLSIVPLIFAILEGQRYPNKWGPDPKAIEHEVWPHRQAGPAYADPPIAPPSNI